MRWGSITDDRTLVMYTIYEHPSDHPNSYVVRLWTAAGGAERAGEMRLATTLDEARRLLPPGLYNLRRLPADDPTIVETWI